VRKPILHLLTTVTLLFTTHIIIAQAPTLGTAANFVLFSAVGAVGNTGTSQLTGNVGTNGGSSTGFGNVNGGMHDNDGASLQCAADLLLAYGQLNSAIPTFFPAPLLGNGDTLNAGIYKITAVTTLSGDLTLNARGNPNAVFIFQIQAAFSTNVSAKIKLINGAQACNVFWKVEGLVSMASKTFFRGTLIANNAAINMNTNDTLEGRALSTAGAVAISGVLAYTPIGCGSALLTGPAAPDLLSTECYALFSANGAVANAGVTNVTGDVGTNVGLTTGYDALRVAGKIHAIPDGSTAACAADLLTVYNYLNTLPNDIELLYPAQFGHNLVLTPHTYIMKAATSFTDTLYLDAEGNTDAVFVIKINGALSTSTFSKVLLINGALAKNVYWKVDGAVNISNNSVFNGTLVCNNGAISLNTGDSLFGRALTTGGAFSTAAIAAEIPGIVSLVAGVSAACRPLPVNWIYFRGKPLNTDVLLEWGTTNEINNGFFTIEKSSNGISFEPLTTVNATTGTANATRQYSFADHQPYSIAYYRISQTDRDGKRNYFRTIKVNMNLSPGLNVLHYVQGDYIYAQVSGSVPGRGIMELFNMDGRKIASQQISLTKELSTYKIDKMLNKGIYLLYIESEGKKLYGGKVIVL
jgi:Ice-binding-like